MKQYNDLSPSNYPYRCAKKCKRLLLGCFGVNIYKNIQKMEVY